jgi:hypothetical protein
MVDYLCEQISKKIQVVMASASFFSFSPNEINTVDNQFWISIHMYVM